VRYRILGGWKRWTRRWQPLALVALWLPCVAVVAGHGDKVHGDGRGYYVYARALALHGDFYLHPDDAVPTESRSSYLQDWYLADARSHGDRVYTQYPAGLSLVWLGPVLAVHGTLLALHAVTLPGVPPADGFSKPYRLATAVTTLLLGLAALVLTYDLALAVAGPTVALVACAAGLYATALFNYLSYETSMSEAPSWFAVTLIFWLWKRSLVPLSAKGTRDHSLALGVSISLATLMRYQHAVLFALPVWAICFGKARDRMARLGWTATGAAPLLVAQLLIWRASTGAWAPPPYATGIDSWLTFRPDQLLWSARHGLIASHPVWLFALIGFGLVAWSGGVWERGLGLFFLFMLWLNQLPYDFWAGHSFGARRFVPVTLVCVLGVTRVFRWLERRDRTWGIRVGTAGVAALSLLSLVYLRDYRAHGELRDLPFPQAKYLGPVFDPVYRTVGWPFSWPANLVWAAEHGVTPDQYDWGSAIFADNPPDRAAFPAWPWVNGCHRAGAPGT